MRVPVVTILLVSVPSLVASQSLGAAARREAKRRAASTGLAKSYSDANLPERLGGAQPAETGPSPAPKEKAAAKTAGPQASPDEILRMQLDKEEAARKEREQYWRMRCRQALRSIELAQLEYDAACGAKLQVSGG